MRLVFVTTTYPPIVGGAETYAQQFATHLAHHHDVSVITRCRHHPPTPPSKVFTYTEPPSISHEDRVTIRGITLSPVARAMLSPAYRAHFYRSTVGIAKSLATVVFGRCLRKTGLAPQIVHWNGTGRELLGYAALDWARRHKAGFAVSPHTHPGSWGDSDLDIDLYRQAQVIFVDTQYELAYLEQRGVPPGLCRIVGNGIDPRTIATSPGPFRERLGLRRFVVLFIGRREVYKGYRQLLDAAPLVWREHVEVSFVLIGPAGTMSDNDDPAINDPRIHDLGAAPESVKQEALSACDILCLPSSQESFGRTVLEAWCYRKPVVAGPAPALVEIAKAGGLVLQSQHPTEIAAAIVRLLTNAQERVTLGQRGYNKVHAQYIWQHVIERAEQAYGSQRP